MNNIIEINNLKKQFKNVKAVDDISIKVKSGELFAFLGLNGAGKSTTINIMCGVLEKDAGKIFIDGKDIDESMDEVKRQLGVVYQSSVLDKHLSIRDNLESRAGLYGIVGEQFQKRLSEISTLLDLKDILNRPLSKLSGGQRRRADIARAIIHEPKILILDEPTTGLDPQTRKLVWDILNGLRKANNITIFLTTHYMEEATDADYVVILDSGKIVAEGTPHELKSKLTGDFITIYNVEESQIQSLNLPYQKVSEGYRVAVENTQKATELILKQPDLFVDYEITKGRMDDVFLSATGKSLGGESK